MQIVKLHENAPNILMTPLFSGHESIIEDATYNFYGNRLATCSSDQKINVFDLDSESQSWTPTASWTAHNANVLRLDWAHPQFGQVIASCSLDRSVKIWQETKEGWIEKALLSDSRAGILQVAFSPPHLGLKLATVAGDAVIRIYEAPKRTDLSKWNLLEELPVLPVGAPPTHSGGTSFALSWCPSRLGGQQLVVAANNFVHLFRPDGRGQWQMGELLQDDCGLVRCVDWAPGGQRGYELIATGSKVGVVRIYKLTESNEGLMIGGGGYSVSIVGQFEHRGSMFRDVQRVKWNVTGTVLSSSGDDGRIRMWKENHLGKWKQHFVLSAEQTEIMDSEMWDEDGYVDAAI